MTLNACHTPRIRVGGILLLAVLCRLTPAGMSTADDDTGKQRESVADRQIEADGLEEFRRATAVPARSPALTLAKAGDLVRRVEGLPEPSSMTAVVLKPTLAGDTYHIPPPGREEDLAVYFNDHLKRAAEQHAGTVLFPENGEYVIAPSQSPVTQKGHLRPHLIIREFTNALIDFRGCHFHCADHFLGIVVKQCDRLTIRNGTIEGKRLLATIARLVPDDGPGGIRFDLLPEFRKALEATWPGQPDLITVGSAERGPDGRWRLDISDYAELFTNRGAAHNNFRYRDGSFISTSPLIRNRNPFPDDQQFVWLLHENNAAHGLQINNEDGCEDLTIEDMRFVNIAGMVIAGEVRRGLHIDNVRVLVADRPQAFLAASSDGIHINANGGDVVIENSTFGPSGDDKISVKGNYWRVTEIDRERSSLMVRPAGRNTSVRRWGWRGDQVVVIDPSFHVIATDTLAADTEKHGSKRHELWLNELPDSIRVGALIGNVTNSGPRVIIQNNDFRDTRAQGILVQSRHVAVLDNRFEGIAGPAIKLNMNPDLWYEAINTGNVLIQDNVFARCSQSIKKSHELIHMHQTNGSGDPVRIIDGVGIRRNHLE